MYLVVNESSFESLKRELVIRPAVMSCILSESFAYYFLSWIGFNYQDVSGVFK
jgi:hypothetical protein